MAKEEKKVRDEAIAFADWIDSNYVSTGQGWLNSYNYLNPDMYGYYAKPNSDFYTTSQLYDIYTTNLLTKKK